MDKCYAKRPPLGPNYDFKDCGYDNEDEYAELQRYLESRRKGMIALYVASALSFGLLFVSIFWGKMP